MISVGIAVSKGKSTICVLKSYGEIVWRDTDCDEGYWHLSSASFDLSSG